MDPASLESEDDSDLMAYYESEQLDQDDDCTVLVQTSQPMQSYASYDYHENMPGLVGPASLKRAQEAEHVTDDEDDEDALAAEEDTVSGDDDEEGLQSAVPSGMPSPSLRASSVPQTVLLPWSSDSDDGDDDEDEDEPQSQEDEPHAMSTSGDAHVKLVGPRPSMPVFSVSQPVSMQHRESSDASKSPMMMRMPGPQSISNSSTHTPTSSTPQSRTPQPMKRLPVVLPPSFQGASPDLSAFARRNSLVKKPLEDEVKDLSANNSRNSTPALPKHRIVKNLSANKKTVQSTTNNVFSAASHGVDESSDYPHMAILNLKLVYEPFRTGFQAKRDFDISTGTVIANRYRITRYIGSAAFSKVVECFDVEKQMLVAVKIITNDKDFLDQSLDEVKILKYLNAVDEHGKQPIIRLLDFLYYKEHLLLVCELLGHNLYELCRHIRAKHRRRHARRTEAQTQENPNRDFFPSVDDEAFSVEVKAARLLLGQPATVVASPELGPEGCMYLSLPCLAQVTRQILEGLQFIHHHGLIHCDLKPENILVTSTSPLQVKLIDFGSSCYVRDHLSSYVQSRSYRAPETILGCSYGREIDVWSVGCILYELYTGKVLFSNRPIPIVLAKMTALLGPFPSHMLETGRYVDRYFKRHMTVADAFSDSTSTEQHDRKMAKSVWHVYHYEDVDDDDEEDDDAEEKEEEDDAWEGKRVLRYVKLPSRSFESFLEPIFALDESANARQCMLFIHFLQKLLTYDPRERLTVTDALNHPWLRLSENCPSELLHL